MDKKVERIIHLYNQLVEGEVLNKAKEAEKFVVNERSIQRDIDNGHYEEELYGEDELIPDDNVDSYMVVDDYDSEEDFDSLFNEISKPRAEGVWVTAVHDQGTISYEAYISNGERRLKAINPKTNKIYWDTMTINIIPMEANYKE